MHPRHMVSQLGAQVALLLVAAALLALLGPDTSQAKDAPSPERALLVKCGDAEVPQVLAALAPLKARIYDLKTMAELHAPCRPPVMAPLPDAGAAMAALREALAGLGKDGGVRLTELRVTRTRLSAAVELTDPTLSDAVPAAVAKHPYFGDRSAQARLGAMTRRDATWTLQLSLQLGEPKSVEPPAIRRVDHIPTVALLRIEQAHELDRIYMSAEKVAVDHRRAARTVSREVTYREGASLTALAAFLEGIAKTPDLTVTELRWKRTAGDLLGKIGLRVAMRTRYAN
jgi:hypothetical protein